MKIFLIQKLLNILQKFRDVYQEGGIIGTSKRSVDFIIRKLEKVFTGKTSQKVVKDVLFINGCALGHPSRYRVDHQIEQLEFSGITTDKIWYGKVDLDLLRYYRTFVIFRCPITDNLKELIIEGKKRNKMFFFDVDDLVFNKKYVKDIQYIKQMNKADYNIYMDGVNRMEEALRLCDYGITTTPTLAKELGSYVKKVYVNRNVASEEMIKHSLDALNSRSKNRAKYNINPNDIVIGYYCGSITHNPDYEMIVPSLLKILDEYQEVKLIIAGILDIPNYLKKYGKRIIVIPFVDWRKLPKSISLADINIVPLEDTLFNRAKSENKWTEASLVKVPTVASSVGAFKEAIVNNKTGILCKNNDKDWYEGLSSLIKDTKKRSRIAINAYEEVMRSHVTSRDTLKFRNFIIDKCKPNIFFVVPGGMSGGLNVIKKHAYFLWENGFDVNFINEGPEKGDFIESGVKFILNSSANTKLDLQIDKLIATLFTTVDFVVKYYKANKKYYLVQNFETDFSTVTNELRKLANSTYFLKEKIQYITISRWCQRWLKKDYGIDSKYCPNGLDLDRFSYVKRKFKNKIHILVEGNCEDKYKNVDESFQILNLFPRDKFYITYLSNSPKKPKDWYKVDKFYGSVPYANVHKLFQNADILLKTSLLESFSYPPLEMMATGGIAVIAENEGIKEYAKHGYNCLIYKQGDLLMAKKYIEEVLKDEKLRKTLTKRGMITAEKRNWIDIENKIIELYK